MPAVLDFRETDIFTAARALLLQIVPSGVEVIRGQANRVPEPAGSDYLVFWPIRRERLSTNVDADLDTVAEGSVLNTTLTVSAITSGGPLLPGLTIAGQNLILGSVLGKQLSGIPGDVGTYAVTPAQNAPAGPIYAGTHAMLTPTEFCLQLDVHGPNSGDTAQVVSTVARDSWACTQIDRSLVDTPVDIQTLYASDPVQMAFIGGESQWAERWTLEWHIQANPTVSVFQDFFTEAEATLIPVDIMLPGAFAIGISAIGVGKMP